ncbi:Similar to vIRF, Macaca mulatta rhadinovirus 26-95 [Macacine gammaherpesvirus 5]|uniref:Similar to vIRF, Macaca mulatta rhadinovirus 26-95 n=1 Tax=Macacine gammaherpesvirus 5 TaxID=154334 RepID=UPI00001637B7|nr:Similar to vIRF, Macaca mulatta rhadinovirus 26-95 [Macacine gammaherpesvirus 5]
MANRDSNYSHLRSWTLYHLNEKTYSDLTWCDEGKKALSCLGRRGQLELQPLSPTAWREVCRLG